MKKLMAIILCSVMLLSTVVSASALKNNDAYPDIKIGEGFVLGDANDDGKVNAVDAITIKRHCASLDKSCAGSADVNGDGSINAKDLLVFKKCMVGKDSFDNYENDQAVNALKIGGFDISEYSIVYHADAKYVENNYYAADTLRKFIGIATGVELDVTTEADKPHKIEFVDVAAIEGLEAELEIENYKYEVVDGDLLIYGTRRGAMYAVYEILEDYLGFRFNNEVFTYQFTQRIASIDEGTAVFRKPYLEFRFCTQSFGNNDQLHYFPNRLNGALHGDSSEALGTLAGPQFTNDHLFAYYWRMATGHVDVSYDSEGGAGYAAKYEAGEIVNTGVTTGGLYYAWTPCLTSDGHYATLFRGMLETMRLYQSWGHIYNDETSVIPFSNCNTTSTCSCIECQFIMDDGTQGRGIDKFNELGCGITGLNLYIANRACDDIKAIYEGRPASTDELGKGDNGYYGYGQAILDYYPDIRICTTLYYHSLPNEKLFTDEGYVEKYGYGYDVIIPRENLIIMYDCNACNNHYMGSGECGDNHNILGLSGEQETEILKAWGEVTKQTGAQMWYWYTPVNKNTYVIDSPNIFNIWYDLAYVVDNCNVTGIYVDGADTGYLFENLKAHLAAKFMWSMVENEDGAVSYMSYDEFISAMQEYLRIHYGEGWEYVYEYICMQDEAGNLNDGPKLDEYHRPVYDENDEPIYAVICYLNECDHMGDMFSYEYMNENYEYMRDLILKGMALVPSDDEQMYQRYEFLLMNVDMIGLSAVRKAWYLSEDATEEQKTTYMERYDWLFSFLKDETLDHDNIKSEEWSGESSHIIVSADQPADWMQQLADLKDYYQYSPYGLLTGYYIDFDGNGKYDVGEKFEPEGETWRRYNAAGWEYVSPTPNWGP